MWYFHEETLDTEQFIASEKEMGKLFTFITIFFFCFCGSSVTRVDFLTALTYNKKNNT